MSFEALIQNFSESFLVTKQPNDINRTHPKYSEYKTNNQSKEELQEIRRKKFIENQKKNRSEILMRLRSLLNETDFESMDTIDGMDTTGDSNLKPKNNRFYVNKYKNQLMLSEWLVQIPEDFVSNWLLVICPMGKRCLVVSSRGQTNAYSRTGYLMNTFVSLLPGGNRKFGRDSKHNCIIDCVYSEIQREFYVLDVMSWNGSDFYDCDTEFRFFWLQSRLESECLEVTQKSKLNPFPFIPLKRYDCSQTGIVSALTSQPDSVPAVDGLLFYHKKTFYTPGVTPLVNWLKPDMVSDVLNISINH